MADYYTIIHCEPKPFGKVTGKFRSYTKQEAIDFLKASEHVSEHAVTGWIGNGSDDDEIAFQVNASEFLAYSVEY